MLPIDDSNDVEILRNEDVVWLEVRVAQNWPVESRFTWHEVWNYPHIIFQAFDVFFRSRILVVHAFPICSFKGEARTPERFEPRRLFGCNARKQLDGSGVWTTVSEGHDFKSGLMCIHVVEATNDSIVRANTHKNREEEKTPRSWRSRWGVGWDQGEGEWNGAGDGKLRPGRQYLRGPRLNSMGPRSLYHHLKLV